MFLIPWYQSDNLLFIRLSLAQYTDNNDLNKCK